MNSFAQGTLVERVLDFLDRRCPKPLSHADLMAAQIHEEIRFAENKSEAAKDSGDDLRGAQ